eukprot:s3012_g11.t1
MPRPRRASAGTRAGVNLDAAGGLTFVVPKRREQLYSVFCGWAEGEFSCSFSQLCCSGLLLGTTLVAFGKFLFYQGSPKYMFSETINACADRFKHYRAFFSTAWSVLTRWEEEEPSERSMIIPVSVFKAALVLSLLWGWPYFAAALMVAFNGLLRPCEFLTLKRRNLLLPRDLLSDLPARIHEVTYLPHGKPGHTVRNQTFIIVEDALLPPDRDWDGICGLGWETISQLGHPLYTRFQEMGFKAMFTFVPQGSRSAHLSVGPFPQHAVKPGTTAWADAEAAGIHGGQRSFWVTTGGIADKFNDLCGVDHMKGGIVFCDCSIVEASRDLPPLRIFIAEHPFELPVEEMFIRVPAKNGFGEACMLAIQPNNVEIGSGLGPGIPLPLPFGLGGLLRDLPKLDGFPFPFPKLGPLLGETEEPSSGSTAPAASPLEGLDMPLFGEGTAGKGALPLPKLLPLFGEKGSGNSMPSLGALHIGPLGKGVLSEQVQEQIHTRPDGTVCKTTIVVVNGKEKSRKEDCSKPRVDMADEVRRLQLVVPMGGILELPLDPSGDASDQDEGAEMWVLGGMFLQRFVVSFDFDQGRIGVAEPVSEVDDGTAARGRGRWSPGWQASCSPFRARLRCANEPHWPRRRGPPDMRRSKC